MRENNMKIETRIKKLEKKVITPSKTKYHTVFINHGEDEDEAIAKFKENNEVDEKDKFWVVQFVSPGDVKNDTK